MWVGSAIPFSAQQKARTGQMEDGEINDDHQAGGYRQPRPRNPR
jgi:hypothetical protein